MQRPSALVFFGKLNGPLAQDIDESRSSSRRRCVQPFMEQQYIYGPPGPDRRYYTHKRKMNGRFAGEFYKKAEKRVIERTREVDKAAFHLGPALPPFYRKYPPLCLF